MKLIVHVGTGTIIDAADDVWVIDTDDLPEDMPDHIEDMDDPAWLEWALEEAGWDIQEPVLHFVQSSCPGTRPCVPGYEYGWVDAHPEQEEE